MSRQFARQLFSVVFGSRVRRRQGVRHASALALGLSVCAVAFVQTFPANAQRGGNWWPQSWTASPDGAHSASQGVRDATRRRAERARLHAELDERLRFRSELVSRDTLEAMQRAITRYRRIVSSGGWPGIPKTEGPWLRPGVRDERVPLLRRRLAISGDYQGELSNSWTLDNELTAALERFQIRHGRRPDGVVDNRTLAALNVRADQRLAQLQVNLLRMRAFHERLAEAGRYVLVNVPSYELQAVTAGKVDITSKVIVGRAETQTPTVEANIRALNFLPYWRVPDSIARRDLIPRIRKDPGYLERENIRILTRWQGEEVDPAMVDWHSDQAKNLKFRQDPGDFNALGLVRVDMPNEHIVYLHDTPLKKLFGRSGRAFSAGCVRVEKIRDLVTWLAAGDNPEWNRARIDSLMMSTQQTDIDLEKHVPVMFVYLTAWASAAGTPHFRPDIYQRDGVVNYVAMYAGEEDDPKPQLSP